MAGMRFILRWLLLFCAATVAAGASGADDLQQWMAEQRAQTRPRLLTVSEPAQYIPLDYTQMDAPDPYSAERLTSILRREIRTNDAGTALIEAELKRRKQPLEAFPLDTMTMVGTLHQQGQDVALVRVDRLLYQVRRGDYLGQNYGLVEDINENAVTLREVVQDAAGDWVERRAELQLQEE